MSTITIWVNNKQQQHEYCIISGVMCNFDDVFSSDSSEHFDNKSFFLYIPIIQKCFYFISPDECSQVLLSALSGWKMSKNRLGLRMFVTWLQTHNKHPTFNAQVAGPALIRSFFKDKMTTKSFNNFNWKPKIAPYCHCQGMNNPRVEWKNTWNHD